MTIVSMPSSSSIGIRISLPSSMDSVGSTDTPFFLASAPISSLERAKELVVAAGGMHAAGEKSDAWLIRGRVGI